MSMEDVRFEAILEPNSNDCNWPTAEVKTPLRREAESFDDSDDALSFGYAQRDTKCLSLFSCCVSETATMSSVVRAG